MQNQQETNEKLKTLFHHIDVLGWEKKGKNECIDGEHKSFAVYT